MIIKKKTEKKVIKTEIPQLTQKDAEYIRYLETLISWRRSNAEQMRAKNMLDAAREHDAVANGYVLAKVALEKIYNLSPKMRASIIEGYLIALTKDYKKIE